MRIPISHQNMSFSTLVVRPGIGRKYNNNNIVIIITQIRTPTKRFLEINVEFAYYSFFLIHLEIYQQIHSYTPVVPSTEP